MLALSREQGIRQTFTLNPIPMKKHILQIGYRSFAYDSVSAATSALAAISKGTRVKYESNGTFVPCDEDETDEIELKLNRQVKMPTKQKRLGLPAPKRNTIECPFCESVSVVRGSNCQSCGEYVP